MLEGFKNQYTTQSFKIMFVGNFKIQMIIVILQTLKELESNSSLALYMISQAQPPST